MIPLLKEEPRRQERRRHQRVKIALLGRYMLSDRQEFPCQSIDVSPGGIALVAPMVGTVGERVVCYLDQIGRIEGTIARCFESGFALGVSVPLSKREKLAEQLTWLANRHSLGMPEDRRHERIIPSTGRAVVRLGDGIEHQVRIIDVSRSGVAFECAIRPLLGTGLTVGKTMGRVVRIFGSGVAVEFSRPFTVEEFDETIVL